MRKPLLLIISATFFASAASAQCKLLTDSIIAGEDQTRYESYEYDGSGRISRVFMVDSGQTSYNSYDSLKYDGSNRLVNVYRMDVGNTSPRQTSTISYNGSNKISRIHVAGDNGSPWTMAHNMTYDGSANLTAVLLDATAISGSPEGFMASFQNIQWSGGNISKLDLVADLGNGPDTLELSASMDGYKNVERLMYVTEGPDMISFYNTNNILTITFDNAEVLGPAGTKALQYAYTYASNQEVITRQTLPGVFDSRVTTQEFHYDCSAGIGDDDQLRASLGLFPNPAADRVMVQLERNDYTLRLMNLQGQVLKAMTVQGQLAEVDLTSYANGMYIVEVEQNGNRARTRLVKN
ncbi:MAG: T9SS type A sorting domain-containing protein [Flavobacteriales bacterium]|nr:T9SS type A sorting domain-containing protein [Flavobacteriales bacterium]